MSGALGVAISTRLGLSIQQEPSVLLSLLANLSHVLTGAHSRLEVRSTVRNA